MKKFFVTLFCFPVLFIYFVGKIIAGSIGLKDNHQVPLAFTVFVLFGVGYGIWGLAKPEDPLADLPEDPQGIFFAPGQGTNSVISVSMLESALYSFHQKYKRPPTNFMDLDRSRIIPEFPEPRAGHKFQLDIEWPVIREVPEDTPDPKPISMEDDNTSK